MHNAPVAVENEIGNASQLLALHEMGDVNHEATELYREVIARLNQHVADHGGKPSGELNIKFKFKLDSGMMEITADVTAKMPKRQRMKNVYFCTANNKLSRRDPRQLEMPLRDVNADTNKETRVG